MLRKALSAWLSAALLVAAPVAFAERAPAHRDTTVQAFGANTRVFTRNGVRFTYNRLNYGETADRWSEWNFLDRGERGQFHFRTCGQVN